MNCLCAAQLTLAPDKAPNAAPAGRAGSCSARRTASRRLQVTPSEPFFSRGKRRAACPLSRGCALRVNRLTVRRTEKRRPLRGINRYGQRPRVTLTAPKGLRIMRSRPRSFAMIQIQFDHAQTSPESIWHRQVPAISDCRCRDKRSVERRQHRRFAAPTGENRPARGQR
jgi:hypothetical protein